MSSLATNWLSVVRKARRKTAGSSRRTFRAAPEAIVLLDLQDRVVRINREFSRIFGYRPDEAWGRPSMSLIVPEELRQEATATRERLARGDSVNLETMRKRKDGSCFPVSELAVPIHRRG